MLGCFDRMLIFGTLPGICFAGGMTSFLFERKIRIFDYPKFAEPYRNRIRENAEQMAAKGGVEIEFIRKRNFRKEDRVKEIIAKRGEQAGWCGSSRLWSRAPPTSHGTIRTADGRTWERYDDGKCLHYYFYFIDEDLGLCYVRVPTWCPFRLQFYCNGHNWLARQLDRKKIGFDRKWRTTPSPRSRIGQQRRSCRTGGMRLAAYIANWMSSNPIGTARFSNRFEESCITGAWTKPNMPPTSCFGGRRT